MTPIARIGQVAVCCAITLGSVWARADTLVMNDGTSVEGTVVEETPETVTLKVKFGKVSYKRAEIKEIKKAGDAAVAAGPLRDVLKLKSGEEHEGLLVSQSDKEVVFDIIMSGKTLSRTMLTRSTYSRDEVAEIKELTDKKRALARTQLENMQAQDDKVTEKSIDVQTHEWQSKDGKQGIPCRKVDLDYFTIESDTNDEFLRKAAFRLGKVYGAYKQHFGIDRNEAAKVRVVIFNSMEEYQAAIGGSIKNPAFYAPDLKLISGGCDVAKYEFQIAQIREYHLQLDQQLDAYKRHIADSKMQMAEQVAKYRDAATQGGKGMTAESKAMLDSVNTSKIRWQVELGEYEKKANEIQDKIYAQNRRNDVIFNEYTHYMFATLYHEGFHAFLDNFLFPEGQSKYVPRWLNEGLAQYFEASRIENDRFILGQEDRNKMAILRKFKKEGGIIPLSKFLNGGPEDYVVHEIANLERSTKNYLQAWNLTHWLGENGRLKRDILQAYVKALMEKKSPAEALPILSGIPNDELEAALDQKLKPSFDQK